MLIRELHRGTLGFRISQNNKLEICLKIRDEMVQKLMSQKGDEHSCDCGHDHAHE